AKTASLAAVGAARDAERVVSLDVNLRPHLWPDRERALATARQIVGGMSLVKAAHDEATLLTGIAAPLEAARALRRWGASLAVVTVGAQGCVFSSARCEGSVPGVPADVVDATGAGDAFQAGLLHALLPHLRTGREPGE